MSKPIQRLIELALHLDCLQAEWEKLVQLKRRERGGWRHPSLAQPTENLEKQLLTSYSQLFTALIASLKGANDDIASGRLLQAKRARVTAADLSTAQEEFGLSDAETQQPLDKSRLVALLALLALWKQKHVALALAAVAPVFAMGRANALAEAKVPDHHPVDDVTSLSAAILARYSDDLARLQAGLQDGTARAYGLSWIGEHAETVGEAAVYLSRLKAAEEYRVGMYAESLLWTAYQSGYREGAVAATKAKLAQLGYASVDAVPDELQDELPRYIWSGPLDERTCDPCQSMFDEPIYADSPDALPLPETICEGGRSCRHEWVLESSP